MTVSGQAFVLWALLLLTLPLNWLLAAIIAACWHETCHALAVVLCGGKIWGLHLKGTGVQMEVSPLNRWQTLLCALAGPCGSFLLLLLAPWFPRLALCGLGQGAFNLLPVSPLDGGRAMVSLLPNWQRHGEEIALAGLMTLALLGGIRGLWGMGIPVMVVIAAIRRKKPCKSSRFRVQ